MLRVLFVILVPTLMLADYLLTVYGAILKDKKYSKHFISETYELNTLWIDTIEKKRWVDYKALIIIPPFTLFVYFLAFHSGMPYEYLELCIGMLLIMDAFILKRHIQNILIFWDVIQSPDAISGRIEFNHKFELRTSQYELIGFILLLAICFIYTSSNFILGGLFGAFGLLFGHFIWLFQYKRKKRKEKEKKNQEVIIKRRTVRRHH